MHGTSAAQTVADRDTIIQVTYTDVSCFYIDESIFGLCSKNRRQKWIII